MNALPHLLEQLKSQVEELERKKPTAYSKKVQRTLQKYGLDSTKGYLKPERVMQILQEGASSRVIDDGDRETLQYVAFLGALGTYHGKILKFRRQMALYEKALVTVRPIDDLSSARARDLIIAQMQLAFVSRQQKVAIPLRTMEEEAQRIKTIFQSLEQAIKYDAMLMEMDEKVYFPPLSSTDLVKTEEEEAEEERDAMDLSS